MTHPFSFSWLVSFHSSFHSCTCPHRVSGMSHVCMTLSVNQRQGSDPGM